MSKKQPLINLTNRTTYKLNSLNYPNFDDNSNNNNNDNDNDKDKDKDNDNDNNNNNIQKKK